MTDALLTYTPWPTSRCGPARHRRAIGCASSRGGTRAGWRWPRWCCSSSCSWAAASAGRCATGRRKRRKRPNSRRFSAIVVVFCDTDGPSPASHGAPTLSCHSPTVADVHACASSHNSAGASCVLLALLGDSCACPRSIYYRTYHDTLLMNMKRVTTCC